MCVTVTSLGTDTRSTLVCNCNLVITVLLMVQKRLIFVWYPSLLQYIPRKMHTIFALLCFVVVTHWLIFPYPSGLLHWHCGNLTIAPVPAKQPWWIWINTSCELIMNDCITTTKQSTTKPCAYFLGYTGSLPILFFQLDQRNPPSFSFSLSGPSSSAWTSIMKKLNCVRWSKTADLPHNTLPFLRPCHLYKNPGHLATN